jgi:hypothetical protein
VEFNLDDIKCIGRELIRAGKIFKIRMQSKKMRSKGFQEGDNYVANCFLHGAKYPIPFSLSKKHPNEQFSAPHFPREKHFSLCTPLHGRCRSTLRCCETHFHCQVDELFTLMITRRGKTSARAALKMTAQLLI